MEPKPTPKRKNNDPGPQTPMIKDEESAKIHDFDKWSESELLNKIKENKGLIVCAFAEKGGTGKSTLIHNLAVAASEISDVRVLVIDADPQGNMISFSNIPIFVYQLNKMLYTDLIENTNKGIYHNDLDNYDLILGSSISSVNQVQFENELGSNLRANTNVLRQNILRLKENYSLILIDLNPTYSATNKILMSCCDHLIYIYNCDPMCVQSIPKFTGELKSINNLRETKDEVNVHLLPNSVKFHSNKIVSPFGFIINLVHKAAINFNPKIRSLNPLPRCESLQKYSRKFDKSKLKIGNYSAHSYKGYFNSVRDTLYNVILDEYKSPTQETWSCQISNELKDNTCLYFIEFDKFYKVGISSHIQNRIKYLNSLQGISTKTRKRLKLNDEEGKILMLMYSDFDTCFTIEQNMKIILHKFKSETSEYYYKKDNNIIIDIIKICKQSQVGSSNDFVLQLACFDFP